MSKRFDILLFIGIIFYAHFICISGSPLNRDIPADRYQISTNNIRYPQSAWSGNVSLERTHDNGAGQYVNSKGGRAENRGYENSRKVAVTNGTDSKSGNRKAPSIAMPCNPNPCGPNSQCIVVNNKSVCSCFPGYTCRAECVTSKDCPLNKACISQKCMNPCIGMCGDGTECEVLNHNPICKCLQRFTENPFHRCYSRTEPRLLKLDRWSFYPCKANDIFGKQTRCNYLTKFTCSPPYCRSTCVSNRECSSHLACIDQKCKDPCLGACGVNAICKVVNHFPICSCAMGYRGDPFFKCNIVKTPVVEIRQTLCIPSPCGYNAICKEQNGAVSCTCLPHYFGNPLESCHPVNSRSEEIEYGANGKPDNAKSRGVGNGILSKFENHRGKDVSLSGRKKSKKNGYVMTNSEYKNNETVRFKHSISNGTKSSKSLQAVINFEPTLTSDQMEIASNRSGNSEDRNMTSTKVKKSHSKCKHDNGGEDTKRSPVVTEENRVTGEGRKIDKAGIGGTAKVEKSTDFKSIFKKTNKNSGFINNTASEHKIKENPAKALKNGSVIHTFKYAKGRIFKNITGQEVNHNAIHDSKNSSDRSNNNTSSGNRFRSSKKAEEKRSKNYESVGKNISTYVESITGQKKELIKNNASKTVNSIASELEHGAVSGYSRSRADSNSSGDISGNSSCVGVKDNTKSRSEIRSDGVENSAGDRPTSGINEIKIDSVEGGFGNSTVLAVRDSHINSSINESGMEVKKETDIKLENGSGDTDDKSVRNSSAKGKEMEKHVGNGYTYRAVNDSAGTTSKSLGYKTE